MGPAGGETGEEGLRGRPRERKDLLPVHRLPGESVLNIKKDDVPSSAMVTYCRRGRRQTASWRGVTALRTGWWGGRTSAPPPPGRLAAPVTVSCRATFLAFLIHQRFSDEEELVVASGWRGGANGSVRDPCTAPALSAPC